MGEGGGGAENVLDYGMQNLLQSRGSGGRLPQKKFYFKFMSSYINSDAF